MEASAEALKKNCAVQAVPLFPPKLDRVEIGPDLAGSRAIVLNFFPYSPYGGSQCQAHTLRLRTGDFHPARIEANKKPTYTRSAVLNGNEVAPAKKK